ncbi:hypothetical protein [Streptomyces sp. NPDC059008]|uniref:hypothetical protein n=1 Tax=unclassified Streptomyces TaxID=2593676 RepID=UPI0036C62DB9
MQLNLPVQGVIDRSLPYEQFLVTRPFKEPDGTPSLKKKQVGGYYGHDVGDPSPLLCLTPQGEECQPVLGSAEGCLL